MKQVKLRKVLDKSPDGKEVVKFTTKAILEQVVRQPGRGIDLDEMRRRCRILNVLDEAKDDTDSVVLEDADFSVLEAAIKANQWGVADVDLLNTIDEVLASKAPDA